MVTIVEAQANKELMGIFIEENMGLVGMTVKQLHFPLSEDFLQEGAIGLFKAACRFDSDRGVQFSSYAVPMIIGEIRRHVRDRDYLHITGGLKVSRDIRQIFYHSLKLEAYEDTEICQRLKITQEQLNEARLVMNVCKSLDEDIHQQDSGDAPISLHSIVPGQYNVEDEATDKIFWEEFMNEAEAQFGTEASRIIKLYRSGIVQTEISKIVGITQVQVSRTLKKIANWYKSKIEGGTEMKITREQLLNECREHGTSKVAHEYIAQKYGMTPGSVSVCIARHKICNTLKEEREKNAPAPVKISSKPPVQIIEEVQKEQNTTQPKQETEPVIQVKETCVSTLKVKAWDGKENTYSFHDGKLIITNSEGVLSVADIKTMIQELQELADKREAV